MRRTVILVALKCLRCLFQRELAALFALALSVDEDAVISSERA